MLQMDMWKLCYLPGRKMVSIPLARTGDSERRQILCEYALEACNEKASGGVFDLTTVVDCVCSTPHLGGRAAMPGLFYRRASMPVPTPTPSNEVVVGFRGLADVGTAGSDLRAQPGQGPRWCAATR